MSVSKANASKQPVLFLFVDGLGMGVNDPAINPLVRGHSPHLLRFIEQHASAIDAGMGVPGLPQSATGQAALLTGINTAKIEGRHVEGFPGARLKEVIRKYNLFRRILEAGHTATFANAYYANDLADVLACRRHSVTTVATLNAFGGVRDSTYLAANKAVYHDLTRAALKPRAFPGPFITPRNAGGHLLKIAAQYDFTLFEYFMTDRAGHKNNEAFTKKVLSELDEFIAVIMERAQAMNMLLALASDHGNLEDCRTHTHTANPVPFAAIGPKSDELRNKVRCITDIADALLQCL